MKLLASLFSVSLLIAPNYAFAESSILKHDAKELSNKLWEEFNHIDQNQNSSINFNEFYAFMMAKNRAEIHEEFNSADSNKNTLISFEESDTFDITLEEFERVDKDKSSFVNFDEFSTAFLRYMFQETDVNHDNKIEFSEFKFAQQHD